MLWLGVNMSNSITIAVDARTLTFQETGERGIGTYTICHLEAWAKQYPQISFKLLTEPNGKFVRGEKLLQLPNITHATYSLTQNEFKGVSHYHVPDSMSMIEGFDSPFRMAPRGIRSSVLFHDLIPLALRRTVYERWHANFQRGYDMRLNHLREAQPFFLVNSEATKNDLVKLANFPADLIGVVHAGVTKHLPANPSAQDVALCKSQLGVEKPFLLVVGGLDEHKGFLHTLEACFDLLKSGAMQLVIVGSMIDPWKMQLKEALSRKGTPGVVFTGFVTDLQLACLYSEAVALCFPSEYEGFGFPVLEAMAHGCPVICSDRASIPEVAGDAAQYLKSVDSKGVFDAIRSILNTPGLRQSLSEKGRVQAQKFSWENVARKTEEYLRLAN